MSDERANQMTKVLVRTPAGYELLALPTKIKKVCVAHMRTQHTHTHMPTHTRRSSILHFLLTHTCFFAATDVRSGQGAENNAPLGPAACQLARVEGEGRVLIYIIGSFYHHLITPT